MSAATTAHVVPLLKRRLIVAKYVGAQHDMHQTASPLLISALGDNHR